MQASMQPHDVQCFSFPPLIVVSPLDTNASLLSAWQNLQGLASHSMPLPLSQSVPQRFSSFDVSALSWPRLTVPICAATSPSIGCGEQIYAPITCSSLSVGLVGRKRQFGDLDFCDPPIPRTGSISPMDRRPTFSATLRPIMMVQEALDFALLHPCPFNCLVHLASSLLHPETIIAGPSSSQIEQLLHITSSLPMFSRIPMSSLAARTLDTKSGSFRPHPCFWQRLSSEHCGYAKFSSESFAL